VIPGQVRTRAPWPARLAALAAASALLAAAQADDGMQSPILLLGGISHRDSASQVGSHGLFGCLSYSSGVAGVFQTGSAGVDLQVRIDGKGARHLQSYEVLYTERIFGIAGGFYLGYGLGSGYERLQVSGPLGGSAKGWRVCGKIMAGYVITEGVALEAEYIRGGSVGGVNTSGLTAGLGLWF
jgi:hypothetical protein